MSDSCRICGNETGNTDYQVREMMFGTRESFRYFQCAACGCLQIADFPEEMGRYYPSGYFSFRKHDRLARSRLRAWFDRRRVRYALEGHGLVGMLASRLARPLDYVHWIKEAGLDAAAGILDVGCGQGKVLLRMRLGGFRRCVGVDPYIAGDIHYSNGVKVFKRELADFAGDTGEPFDLIMFHHSLEHMARQQDVLAQAARLLSPQGCILVRIPMAEGEAWERYREHWAQLDAPRHFYLHSRRSMELLAAQAGLVIRKVEYDSTVLQFVGSELYRRDIPMNAGRSRTGIFTRRQLKAFRQQAKALNASGRGDQAVFYLAHQPPAKA
ncbi:ubiquinone biosynthesis O-methyltransferase [mine drainage metagenome]|uniref:Ubiquinone biosynthesis O-methyltransferase n=1 Tax=mine drainage metagenome TaxID=410659 RepID=A0A1J5QS97_9ZZZZ